MQSELVTIISPAPNLVESLEAIPLSRKEERNHRILMAFTVALILHFILIAAVVLFKPEARSSAPGNDALFVTLEIAGRDLEGSKTSTVAISVAPAKPSTQHIKKPLVRNRSLKARPNTARPKPEESVAANSAEVLDGVTRQVDLPSVDGGPPGGSKGEGIQGEGPFAAGVVDQPPEVLTRVVPDYPEGAKAKGIEGEIIVRLIVDKEGMVERIVEVVQSIPELNGAAVEALLKWRFRPGRVSGEPVRVLIEIPIRFELD